MWKRYLKRTLWRRAQDDVNLTQSKSISWTCVSFTLFVSRMTLSSSKRNKKGKVRLFDLETICFTPQRAISRCPTLLQSWSIPHTGSLFQMKRGVVMESGRQEEVAWRIVLVSSRQQQSFGSMSRRRGRQRRRKSSLPFQVEKGQLMLGWRVALLRRPQIIFRGGGVVAHHLVQISEFELASSVTQLCSG
jgi:hypothetical protein